MTEKTVTITHNFGIHARPAARIVSLCTTFASDIAIEKKGEATANAKNILDIMMLAAGCGTQLTIRAVGTDEAEAIEQLGKLMESEFE